MAIALWLLGILGVVILTGILFTCFHPNLQRWGEGMPNKEKK
jgi:hypothetical protein